MKRAQRIFFKEWREMLRDQRVIFGVFIGPLAFTVLIFMFLGKTIESVGKTAKEDVIALAVYQPQNGAPILEPLKKTGRFKVTEVKSPDEGEQILKDRKAKLLLLFDADAQLQIMSEQTARFSVRFDPSETKSEIAKRVIEEQVAAMNREIVKKRLAARSLSPNLAEPIKAESKPLEGRTENFIVTLIPYFLMLWSLMGGMTIASDLVAGEKERGTLETLLTSPVTRNEVVIGKFLALMSQAWLGLLLQVVGLGIGWALMPKGAGASAMGGLQLNPETLALAFVLILPYSVLTSSILFALSTFARNQREAQGYVTAVSFIFMIPIIFGQFLAFFDFANKWYIGLIPVINVFKTLRDALSQQMDWQIFGLTMGSMSALALGALYISARMFRRESVLFRV
ncbi:MAG: ABC transporter permease [Armatimonadetes bacterium]|nr:ABC transporter permease [Armatimonadota bacterium]